MVTYKEMQGGTVRVEVSGTLRKQDYLMALPALDAIHKRHGKVNYVIELVDFHGWTPAAVVEELKFDASHRKDFGRVAIVGDSKWQSVATKVGAFVFPAEMKFFPHESQAEAEEWAREGNRRYRDE